jgi:hypothetical protein
MITTKFTTGDYVTDGTEVGKVVNKDGGFITVMFPRYGYRVFDTVEMQALDFAAPAGCTCGERQWDAGSLDCPLHGEENEKDLAAEHAAEMAAENAWLHHAENAGFYDDPRGD